MSIISHQIKEARVSSFSQFSKRSSQAMAADRHHVLVSYVTGPFHVLRPPPSQAAVAGSLSRPLCSGGCFGLHAPPPGLLWPGSPPALDPSQFPLQLTDLIPCRQASVGKKVMIQCQHVCQGQGVFPPPPSNAAAPAGALHSDPF